MKKFLVLYKAPVEEFQKMMTGADKDAQKKGMEEWQKWMDTHKADLADMGAPVGKTKQVMASGITDIKNDIGGYSVVQAESHDAAAKLLSDSPHFKIPRASIEVSEIMEMDGTK